MKFLSKKEENGITTVAYIGAFKLPYIEVLDFINSAASFFDKTGANAEYTNKFIFDADRNRTPVKPGELYKQPKSYGVGITGVKGNRLNSLELTVCAFTDTRRFEVSFNTEAGKAVIDDDGNFISEDTLMDTLLDIISKLEILGAVMSEQGYSMTAFKKALEAYVENPEKNDIISRGSSWFNIKKTLEPKQTEPENKE